MRKTRVKKLRKELQSIMDFAYKGAPFSQCTWRAFKRNYVRS